MKPLAFGSKGKAHSHYAITLLTFFFFDNFRRNFSVQTLLQDEELAKQFQGCSVGVFRLAPQDYHRYHIPVDGVIGPSSQINGTVFTPSPPPPLTPHSLSHRCLLHGEPYCNQQECERVGREQEGGHHDIQQTVWHCCLRHYWSHPCGFNHTHH